MHGSLCSQMQRCHYTGSDRPGEPRWLCRGAPAVAVGGAKDSDSGLPSAAAI